MASNQLIAPAALNRLGAEGGVCIVAAHLGKRFTNGGVVSAETKRLLERLAAKPTWFVPVGEVLDWLRSQREGVPDSPRSEWRKT